MGRGSPFSDEETLRRARRTFRNNPLDDLQWAFLYVLMNFAKANAQIITPEDIILVRRSIQSRDTALHVGGLAAFESIAKARPEVCSQENFDLLITHITDRSKSYSSGWAALCAVTKNNESLITEENLRRLLSAGPNDQEWFFCLISSMAYIRPEAFTPANFQLVQEMFTSSDQAVRRFAVKISRYFVEANSAYATRDLLEVLLGQFDDCPKEVFDAIRSFLAASDAFAQQKALVEPVWGKTSDSDPTSIAGALEVLGRLLRCNPSAADAKRFPYVVRMLQHENSQVRREAFGTLLAFLEVDPSLLEVDPSLTRSAISSVLPLIADEDYLLREAAIE